MRLGARDIARSERRGVAEGGKISDDPPLLIGTVVEAQRTVRVDARSKADAAAKVPIILGWLKRMGLVDAEAMAGGEDDEEAAARIVLEKPMPVAFKPAYILQNQSNGKYRVEKFDPSQTEHLQLLIGIPFGQEIPMGETGGASPRSGKGSGAHSKPKNPRKIRGQGKANKKGATPKKKAATKPKPRSLLR
jgi:hypothetical protein